MSQINAVSELDFSLKDIALIVGLSWENTKNCLDDPKTHQIIQSQTVEAKNAMIEGTPSFFVNGRKLPRAQILPVLEGAISSLKQK